MALLDELLIGLGYDFDDDDLKNFEKASAGLTKTIAAVSAAAVAGSVALLAFTKSSTSATDVTAKTARELRVAVGQYDALRFASEQLTGDSAALASSMQSLAVRASEAAKGTGSGVEAFGLLGISVTDTNGKLKTTDKLLLETSDALNALGDQGQRLELEDKLGLRELDLLLQAGSSGIQELIDEAKVLGVVTDEQAKAAEGFNDAWNSILRVGSAIQREIVTELLPAFREITDGVKKWFIQNRKIIKQNIGVFIKGTAKLLSTFWEFLKAIGNVLSIVIEKLGGFENALKLVGFAIMGVLALKFLTFLTTMIALLKAGGIAALLFQAKLLLIPILIGALVAAIAAIIEDVITFFQGGESALGKFLDKFPIVKEIFDGIAHSIGVAWEALKSFGSTLTDIGGKVVDFTVGLGDSVLGFIGFGNGASTDTSGITNNSSTASRTDIGKVEIKVESDNPQQAAEKINDILSEIAENGVKNTGTTVVI